MTLFDPSLRDDHLALLRRALEVESLPSKTREAFGDMLAEMTTARTAQLFGSFSIFTRSRFDG